MVDEIVISPSFPPRLRALARDDRSIVDTLVSLGAAHGMTVALLDDFQAYR